MQQVYLRTPNRCSLVNLLHIFRTTFFRNTYGRASTEILKTFIRPLTRSCIINLMTPKFVLCIPKRCSLVNLLHIFRTTFFKNTYGRASTEILKTFIRPLTRSYIINLMTPKFVLCIPKSSSVTSKITVI